MKARTQRQQRDGVGNRRTSDLKKLTDVNERRAKVEADIAAFEARGRKVEKVPLGVGSVQAGNVTPLLVSHYANCTEAQAQAVMEGRIISLSSTTIRRIKSTVGALRRGTRPRRISNLEK